MKKILFAVLLSSLIGAKAQAASTGTDFGKLTAILNPQTGRADYINNTSSVSLADLFGVSTRTVTGTQANNGDVLTFTFWTTSGTWMPKTPTGGSSGGGSLQSFIDSASGLAISSMNMFSSQFIRTTAGSSATFALNPASVTLQGNLVLISTVASGLQALFSGFNAFTSTAQALGISTQNIQSFFAGFTSTSDAQQTKFENFESSTNVAIDFLKGFTSTSDARGNTFINFRSTTDAFIGSFLNFESTSDVNKASQFTAAFSSISAVGISTRNIQSFFAGYTSSSDVNSTSQFAAAFSSIAALISTAAAFAPPPVFYDEGTALGSGVTSVNCVGSAITCTQSQSTVTITITASGSGSASAGAIYNGSSAQLFSTAAFPGASISFNATFASVTFIPAILSTWTAFITYASTAQLVGISTQNIQAFFAGFTSTSDARGNTFMNFRSTGDSAIDFLKGFTSTSDAQQTKFENFESSTNVAIDFLKGFTSTSDARGNTFINFRSTTDSQMTTFQNFRSTTDTQINNYITIDATNTNIQTTTRTITASWTFAASSTTFSQSTMTLAAVTVIWQSTPTLGNGGQDIAYRDRVSSQVIWAPAPTPGSGGGTGSGSGSLFQVPGGIAISSITFDTTSFNAASDGLKQSTISLHRPLNLQDIIGTRWGISNSTGIELGIGLQLTTHFSTNDAMLNALSNATTTLAISSTIIFNQESPDISNRTYYVRDETTGTASLWRLLGSSPAVTAEVSRTVSIIASGGIVRVSSNITAAGDPGVRKIPAGVWSFTTWAQAASILNSVNLVITVSTVSFNNTQITEVLSSTSSNFLTTDVQRFDMVAIQTQDVFLSTSDRILVQYFGQTTAGVGFNFTMYYAGTTRFSHLTTPIGAVYKFTQLSDAPQSLIGQAGKYLSVNADQTSTVFVTTITDNLNNYIITNASNTNMYSTTMPWSAAQNFSSMTATSIGVSSIVFPAVNPNPALFPNEPQVGPAGWELLTSSVIDNAISTMSVVFSSRTNIWIVAITSPLDNNGGDIIFFFNNDVSTSYQTSGTTPAGGSVSSNTAVGFLIVKSYAVNIATNVARLIDMHIGYGSGFLGDRSIVDYQYYGAGDIAGGQTYASGGGTYQPQTGVAPVVTTISMQLAPVIGSIVANHQSPQSGACYLKKGSSIRIYGQGRY